MRPGINRMGPARSTSMLTKDARPASVAKPDEQLGLGGLEQDAGAGRARGRLASEGAKGGGDRALGTVSR